MKITEWFKSKIGQKVTVKQPGKPNRHVIIDSRVTADQMYKSQSSAGYSYADHIEDGTNNLIFAEVLLSEIDGIEATSQDSQGFDGFGGGQSDGAGAGGSWDGSNSDSGSSFDSGGYSPDY